MSTGLPWGICLRARVVTFLQEKISHETKCGPRVWRAMAVRLGTSSTLRPGGWGSRARAVWWDKDRIFVFLHFGKQYQIFQALKLIYEFIRELIFYRI